MIIEELNLLKAIFEARGALDSRRNDLDEFAQVVLSLGHAWLAYESKNCGTGAGGFQPGNTCGRRRRRRKSGNDARRRRRRKVKGPRSVSHAELLQRHEHERRELAVSIKNRRKSLRDHHAKIQSEAEGRISREELRELEKGQSKERKAEKEQHSSDADALRDIHRGQDIELASQERKERASSRSTRRHPNGSSPAGHDPSLRPDDLSSVTHPVTGSQLYLDYIDRYGFQNVEWSRIPDYTGGKTSGILTLPFGDFFIKSGYSGPTDGVPKKVIPGMNNILKAHVEAHSAVLMRKLDLNYAVLILNRVPCIQGQAKKSGCHFMLPRMLGAGRVLRVIVPQVLDRNYDGINL